MSKYVLTVIFSHVCGNGITSKVYHLNTKREAETILSNLKEDIGVTYNIRASVACIGEEND